MKPEKFDENWSLETFLWQFDNCSRYNRWDATDQAAHLRWSLSGTTAQVLWMAKEITYDQLLEKLGNWFGAMEWNKFSRSSYGAEEERAEKHCGS
jgi:hypothetical protein